MLREGYEDIFRHINDRQTNATEAHVLIGNEERKIQWADIQVGNLIKIYQDEPFPADIVVLGSSIKDGNCYIETGALDGEKNLKPKSAFPETQEIFQSQNFDQSQQLNISAMSPNQDLYQYSGYIEILCSHKKLATDHKQLVLRGAFLRNTEWIIGCVVYTGLDTKIMKNSESSKIKFSDVESKMNHYILCILFFQLSLSVISAILNYVWNDKHQDGHYYLEETETPKVSAVYRFFTYFILYNTMIPISLIVSLELVKLAQSYFIEKDENMYVKSKDKWPSVMTCTINEELGQVEYVFSDKTGTLTCNVMQFKMCMIGKILYGYEAFLNPKKVTNEHVQMSDFTFRDDTLVNLIKEKKGNANLNLKLKSVDGKSEIIFNSQYDLVNEFFTLLGSAHECILNKTTNIDFNDLSSLKYAGPSPDEITLVDAAKYMGKVFVGSSAAQMYLYDASSKVQETYELVNKFEFDSTRKRMSIIIKDPKGNYKMFIKGADNIIKMRLHKNIEQPFLECSDNQLKEFAKIGLRTLLVAMKVMSKEEVDNFKKAYEALADDPQREEKLKNLVDSIENDFFLLGMTAVEDKLQDNVPETIADLLKANIKVWMLTGDKLETAENIAKSCKLIQSDMKVITVSEKNLELLTNKMNNYALKEFEECMIKKQKKSFLIEGDSLTLVLANKPLLDQFVHITKDCESVVCCRVSPKQKAQVVRTIRNSLKKITLAIGDGANDVNMIQEAQIGCGIYGNEGMRAVQASDFAFGEFQCLWRLLLVHGRWSYIRISEMILYFFYKNMVFTIPQLYFAIFSAFSGQTLYDDYYITLYNLCFTALPLMIRAIFDQDVNYKFVKPQYCQYSERAQLASNKVETYIKNKLPYLYYLGQQKRSFNIFVFGSWILMGIIHSLIIFFATYYLYKHHIFFKQGYTTGLWALSLIQFTTIILAVDIKIAFRTKSWTAFNYIAFWVTSIALYFAFMVASEFFEDCNAYGTPFQLFKSASFYLTVIIIVAVLYIFEYTIIAYSRIFKKTKIDQLRQFMLKKKDQLNFARRQTFKIVFKKSNSDLSQNTLVRSFYDMKLDNEKSDQMKVENLEGKQDSIQNKQNPDKFIQLDKINLQEKAEDLMKQQDSPLDVGSFPNINQTRVIQIQHHKV